MANTLLKDHHLLTRNLRLNGKYISNDGDDEGFTIDDDGTINLSSPNLTTGTTSGGTHGDSNVLSIKYDGSNYTDIRSHADGHLRIENFGTDADMTLIAKDEIFLEAASIQ